MPKKKSKLPVDPTRKDYEHYNAVLLEEVRSKMDAVIEATDSTRTSLEAKIEAVRVELKQEIQITQMAVQKNSEDIQLLRSDVKEIKQTLDGVDCAPSTGEIIL